MARPRGWVDLLYLSPNRGRALRAAVEWLRAIRRKCHRNNKLFCVGADRIAAAREIGGAHAIATYPVVLGDLSALIGKRSDAF